MKQCKWQFDFQMNIFCFGLVVEMKSDFAVLSSMLIGVHLQSISMLAYASPSKHLSETISVEQYNLHQQALYLSKIVSHETFILVYWCLNGAIEEETAELRGLKNKACLLCYAITTARWPSACPKK